jgi:hypothetical protein
MSEASELSLQFVPAQRPRWLRFAAALAPLVLSIPILLVSLLFFGGEGAALAWMGVAAFTTISNLALALAPNLGQRTARVLLRPGVAEVVYPYWGSNLRYLIHARDVVGASTTRSTNGQVVLHLQTAQAAQPHTLVLQSEDEARQIMRSLGLHHDGTGALQWRNVNDSSQIVLAVLGLVGSMMTCGLASVLISLYWPFQARAQAAMKRSVALGLREDGVHVPGRVIPFSQVAGVSVAGRTMTLLGEMGVLANVVFTTRVDEVERIADQIRAASRRARGERVLRDSAVSRVTQLSRHATESLKDWLARVEATAVGADYRGMGVEAHDLWEIAEDPSEHLPERAEPAQIRVAVFSPTDEAALALAEIEDEHARA